MKITLIGFSEDQKKQAEAVALDTAKPYVNGGGVEFIFPSHPTTAGPVEVRVEGVQLIACSRLSGMIKDEIGRRVFI